MVCLADRQCGWLRVRVSALRPLPTLRTRAAQSLALSHTQNTHTSSSTRTYSSTDVVPGKIIFLRNSELTGNSATFRGPDEALCVVLKPRRTSTSNTHIPPNTHTPCISTDLSHLIVFFPLVVCLGLTRPKGAWEPFLTVSFSQLSKSARKPARWYSGRNQVNSVELQIYSIKPIWNSTELEGIPLAFKASFTRLQACCTDLNGISTKYRGC